MNPNEDQNLSPQDAFRDVSQPMGPNAPISNHPSVNPAQQQSFSSQDQIELSSPSPKPVMPQQHPFPPEPQAASFTPSLQQVEVPQGQSTFQEPQRFPVQSNDQGFPQNQFFTPGQDVYSGQQKRSKKLFFIVPAFSLLFVGALAGGYFFLSGTKDPGNYTEEEALKESSYSLIKNDLIEGKIDEATAASYTLDALVKPEELKAEYQAEGSYETEADLDLIEKHFDSLDKQKLALLYESLKPPKIVDEVAINYDGKNFETKAGDDSVEKPSFIQETHAVTKEEVGELNAKIEAKDFIVYYATKGKHDIKDASIAKIIASSMQSSNSTFGGWGFPKPKSSGKVPIYLIRRESGNALAATVHERLINKFIMLFKGEGFDAPFVNYYLNSMEGFSKDIKIPLSQLYKGISQHEGFHLVDTTSPVLNTVIDNNEINAQWASLQTSGDSPYHIYKLSKYYSRPEKSLYKQDIYSLFLIHELATEKLGKGFVKKVIDEEVEDIFSYIGKKTDFSKFFHEFAVRNYKLDYKKGIMKKMKRPKITKSIDLKSPEQKLELESLAVNYLAVDLKNTESKTISFKVDSKNDKTRVTILSNSLKPLETFSLDKDTTKDLSKKGDKFVIVVSNGDSTKGGKIAYQVSLRDEGDNTDTGEEAVGLQGAIETSEDVLNLFPVYPGATHYKNEDYKKGDVGYWFRTNHLICSDTTKPVYDFFKENESIPKEVEKVYNKINNVNEVNGEWRDIIDNFSLRYELSNYKIEISGGYAVSSSAIGLTCQTYYKEYPTKKVKYEIRIKDLDVQEDEGGSNKPPVSRGRPTECSDGKDPDEDCEYE